MPLESLKAGTTHHTHAVILGSPKNQSSPRKGGVVENPTEFPVSTRLRSITADEKNLRMSEGRTPKNQYPKTPKNQDIRTPKNAFSMSFSLDPEVENKIKAISERLQHPQTQRGSTIPTIAELDEQVQAEEEQVSIKIEEKEMKWHAQSKTEAQLDKTFEQRREALRAEIEKIKERIAKQAALASLKNMSTEKILMEDLSYLENCKQITKEDKKIIKKVHLSSLHEKIFLVIDRSPYCYCRQSPGDFCFFQRSDLCNHCSPAPNGNFHRNCSSN